MGHIILASASKKSGMAVSVWKIWIYFGIGIQEIRAEVSPWKIWIWKPDVSF